MQGPIERRLAILERLCERRYDKIRNLAREFNVSERTMRRDIQYLSISYPIYTMTGNETQGGGVHVVEGYHMRRKYLNPHQEKMLEALSEKVSEEERRVIYEILDTFSIPKAGGKNEGNTCR